MPIKKHEPFNLLKHVVPVLEQHRMRWQWGQGDYGAREGLIVEGGYIHIVRGNELYVEGTQELADFLLEYVRPFGEEITIHLYPQKVTIGPDRRQMSISGRLADWFYSLKNIRME